MTRKPPAKPNAKDRKLADLIIAEVSTWCGVYSWDREKIVQLLASARCGKGGRKGKGRA